MGLGETVIAMNFTVSIVEDAALAWLEALGYAVFGRPDIAAGESGESRSDSNCRDVVPKTLIASELRMANADHFLREAV